MKKIIAFVLLIALVSAFVTIPASAIPEGCTAIDITDQVKFATVLEAYTNRMPIVRDDAQFIKGDEHRTDTDDYVAPGGGTRQIMIEGFDDSNCKDMLQFDASYDWELANDPKDPFPGSWSYIGSVWPNNTKEGDALYKTGKARLVYDFEVSEAGTYEFVFVGTAQIKVEDVGNDAKDRGFTFAIDGGEKQQVNVSDAPFIFRAYNYTYTMQQAQDGKDGDAHYYYQMGYTYGITAELSKGKHQLEYLHLEYSGDTVTNGGNGSRLNLAGIYVQKALSEIELAAYVYPAYIPPETPAPTEPTPTEPAETKPTETEPTETKPEGTNAPDTKAPETGAPKNEGGCASAVVSSVAVVVMACAAAVALKKKD